jgi:O-antigen ligase
LCFSISVLIFPLFPALGAVGLFALSLQIWRLNYQSIISSRYNQSLGILAVLLIVSSAFAQQPPEAWLGLANFLPFFWLFVALKELIQQPVQLKQLSWLLILPSFPIVILGLAQLYLLWDTPRLLESILGWELVPQGVPTGRMSSVFIYTNFLAIYLAIAFSLGLGLWLDTWQIWRQKSNSKQTQILVLLSVILLADISGLILTSSRNAWILAVISFMAYALYMRWRWLIWGVTGAATSILWAAFAPSLGGTQLRKVVPTFFWARLSDQTYDRPIETLRITQWQFCWDLIQGKPWLGWGLRNFSPLYEAKTNYWFGHPHSLYLMLSAETGIISTCLFLVIVGLIMYQASVLLLNWTNDRDRLIYFSYLLVFFCCILFNFSDVTVFDLRVNTIIWIILAAIGGIVASRSTNN